jgi:hypothetical protein
MESGPGRIVAGRSHSGSVPSPPLPVPATLRSSRPRRFTLLDPTDRARWQSGPRCRGFIPCGSECRQGSAGRFGALSQRESGLESRDFDCYGRWMAEWSLRVDPTGKG